jgi:alpha-amylase/alpha-mannosidase (GH57 family)
MSSSSRRDGDTYYGPYSFDKETEVVKGCPARSFTIKSYIKVIASKSGAKGAAAATRHHAEAMGLEDLKKIIQWSEIQYQSELAVEPKDIKALMLAVEHAIMRAFMTSGFTLWTR